ncbi:NADH dehydrogenase [ubiquinone] 1 alpha subcomplex assembly factor 4 [Microcaecilia unicolor]|uniref:NADH dehydrogenase [ubiquinone] 1 alpha subcomplex assembly factor 4 n=1 Tax=Microcaecilia unicolor TaxID=1415580 RepID=A0A6P7X7F1_9AMPH|nr:NADH dehydrogenase [ubiquinone] 1 alpha subcomplex assembly factor 4 [Microcaecilia unicolor]
MCLRWVGVRAMGPRVSRALRNFNLETRAHQEIGREKPELAPRHTIRVPQKHPEVREEISKKNDHLLSLLKDVYVDSADPPVEVKNQSNSDEQMENRVPKVTVKHDAWGILDPPSIPKGKLSVVEALSLLSNHKNSPTTWTAEKIAEEYILELKDTKALLEFFIPFDLKLIPPKDTKQIKST